MQRTVGRWARRRLAAAVAVAVAVAAVVTACGGGTAGVEVMPKPAFSRGLVLTGPEGARVNVAEFGADQALFEIVGVRTPAAGFVFLGTVSDDGGGRTTYQTTWDGRPFHPIHREASGGDARWRLYAPGLSDAVELRYDEAASAALDVDALYARHAAQVRDGSLARVQTFDRAAAEAEVERELGEEAARVGEECGATPTVAVEWATVPDRLFTEDRLSLGSYCGAVLDALRNVCRFEPGKALARARAGQVTCRWSDEGWSLRAGEGGLAFTTAQETNLADKAREALLALDVEGGMTLREAIDFARTDVCVSADDVHVLAVHPHVDGSRLGISYGTRTKLHHTPQTTFLSRGWFFEPREFAPRHAESFRGMDMRYFSYVEVDAEAGRCELTCGERTSEWRLLPPDAARALLQAAETVPGPFDREPHALARDRRGTYYYVDRGVTEATRRDYRVYRGPRGNLRRLEMRDVASDSEGEVFSTATGELRLVVDAERAQWITGARATELRRVPVHENYRLIYGELGVYLGQRFELPCDDH